MQKQQSSFSVPEIPAGVRWPKALKKDRIAAYSAGVKKYGLNPFAVKAMVDAGVDISKHESSLINELPIGEFDWVITLCGHADETCPLIPEKEFM